MVSLFSISLTKAFIATSVNPADRPTINIPKQSHKYESVAKGTINENRKKKIPKLVALPTPHRLISFGANSIIIRVPIAMQKIANPNSPSSIPNLDFIAGMYIAQVPKMIFKVAKTNAGAKYLVLVKINFNDFILVFKAAKLNKFQKFNSFNTFEKNLIMRLIILLSFFFILISCKKETNKEVIEPVTELSTAQKIANVNGFENWKNVSEIEFTFNTSRGARSWSWQPKTQNVVLINKGDTIAYNRTKIDSLSLQADRSFINDKFWLLAPYQLVWDKGTTISEPVKEIAPISKIELNKITITYSNEGGYTPGDAYDFYFGDDFMIKEWIYRKENSETPTLMTTWEDYQDFNGIKISTMHKNLEDNWQLYFTGIKVITE